MQKTLCGILFTLFLNYSYSQDKYLTTSGNIDFFSQARLENIEAINDQVLSIVNLDNNEIVIHVLMKSFFFEKSLMQEHFNENYIESDKYPKAKFKGKILGFNPDSSSNQRVVIQGELSLHGKTKKIRISSIAKLKNEKLRLEGYFRVLVKDFGIKIPRLTVNNIAKSIKVSFDLNCRKLKK